jgi:hypothetical protein
VSGTGGAGCQVLVVDDAGDSSRLNLLVQKLIEVGDLRHWSISVVPRAAGAWPELPALAARVPVVALIHWSDAAAQHLISALLHGRTPVAAYSRNLRALVAYRGGGGKNINLGIRGLERDGCLVVAQPDEGAAIPVLPIQKPVARGSELTVEELGELLAWCLAENRSHCAMPGLVVLPESWLIVAAVLLKGYLAARRPEALSLSLDLKRVAGEHAGNVLHSDYWASLMTLLDSESAERPPDQVFFYLAARLLRQRSIPVPGWSEWLDRPPERPEDLDARALALWLKVQEALP